MCSPETHNSHHNRCVRPRVEGPCRTQSTPRPMVTQNNQQPHKSQGAPSNPKGDQKLGKRPPGGSHPILDRQPNGSLLHIKTRGIQIMLHDRYSQKVVSTCKLVKHLPSSELHSWRTQYGGRHVLQSRSNTENRVNSNGRDV